ncbi:2-dehydropantoate 2-reductase [Jannaschia marina]|uniref:2-dehydropantoate 2-reductase n=1 Tax=Jannaschia marina TaxID=2741674 RepID=UPI0015CB922E|nr:2-dehydropantoate 2-reductase [Jannaschia marina]
MTPRIAILGAGAIGTWAGGLWAGAGDVTLIGRPRVIDGLRGAALRLSGAPDPAAQPTLSTAPEALEEADLIVLATKATALEPAMAEIARHARTDAAILSLLNGLDPVRRLRARFPERDVLAGMVPFNVVWEGPSTLHRTGAGTLAVERHALTAALPGVERHDDLTALQYGKLLLNLVNPVNALAARPLRSTLLERGYRRVFAAALAEALRVYRAAGVEWRQVGPTSPWVATQALRAPTWVFERLVLRRQKLDPTSMTSMASDLAVGRATEIDVLNGEIPRLAQTVGTRAPVNARLVTLVQEVEAGRRATGLSPDEMEAQVLG